ncbi:MAG: hypothetical protein HYW47_00835 [Deltaproteobacteria bacterium]|nr:hypothetical protein [Deltaproteobacteria bacterium]
MHKLSGYGLGYIFLAVFLVIAFLPTNKLRFKKVSNIKYYLGVFFLLTSYMTPVFSRGTCHLFLGFGCILIFDRLTEKFYGKSLLQEISQSFKNILIFFFISTISGIILECGAQWLGKVWFYPYADIYTYSILFIPGFAIYWLIVLESYAALKGVLNYFRNDKKNIYKEHAFEPFLQKTLGFLGIILIPISIFLILKDYAAYGGYFFSLNQKADYPVKTFLLMMFFLGFLFLFEFILYLKKTDSFLKEMLHCDFVSLLAILLAAAIMGIFMETHNTMYYYWEYSHWPLQHIKLFNVPIIILLAWPFHYFIILYLFRIFWKKTITTV